MKSTALVVSAALAAFGATLLFTHPQLAAADLLVSFALLVGELS